MSDNLKIVILFLENDSEFAEFTIRQLSATPDVEYDVIWKKSFEDGLIEIEKNQSIDILLLKYFLSNHNGLEILRILNEKKFLKPVVFLTSRVDLKVAIEAMKLGAKDVIMKDDVKGDILSRVIMTIVEKETVKNERAQLEIRTKRLEAMHKVISDLVERIDLPLNSMKEIVEKLLSEEVPVGALKYLNIIKDNLNRLEIKKQKLMNLKDDKTVKYIKDIKMIDIS
jgi:FixJ family two-component response regulator